MIDAAGGSGGEHQPGRGVGQAPSRLPAPAAPSAPPRYSRVSRMLAVGCLASLGLFTLVYVELWSQSGTTRAWLPWATLTAGLAITFYAATNLLTAVGHAIRHEDVAQLRARQLVAHRDREREVLARVRDAVVVTDPDGYVAQWNEAARRTLGDHLDGATGRHCGEVLGIRSVDRPLDCREGCALLDQVGEDSGPAGVEVLREREDGSLQPLLASVGAVRRPDGKPIEIVHSLRDITRLREADDAKTMFLATTSHELRTPLAVIRGFAETLANRDVDDATRDAAITTILQRVDRTDTPSASATRAADEWGFETRYGTLATPHVDAEFLGSGRDGVERFELLIRFGFDEAHVFEAALSQLEGTRIRNVVDGSNVVVDDTGGSNTVIIRSPVGSVVADSEYVVLGFESERLNDAFQAVTAQVVSLGTAVSGSGAYGTGTYNSGTYNQ